jgi:hypothetical protein
MGNGKFLLIFALLAGGLVMNCTQEPLFFDIANEIPPIEPIIGGAPSRIVEIGGNLYAANGNIWEYYGNWYKITQPPGHIKAVASAGSTLFALTRDGVLYKRVGINWIPVGGSSSNSFMEQIFGANGYLFVGALTGTAGTANGYSILSMAESDPGLTKIQDNTGLLTGAVYQSGTAKYFLGTRGQGIYEATNPLNSLGPPYLFGTEIIGLIEHNSGAAILAVMVNSSDNCTVFRFTGGNFQSIGVSGGFSGAMASWNVGGDWLLLLGLQRSSGSYGYGYREVQVDGAGAPLSGLRVPGESHPSSVILDYQYTNAIGQHAVNALHVVDGSNGDGQGRPIIFASTQKNGLWSYRSRGGQPQWNGEDNSLP